MIDRRFTRKASKKPLITVADLIDYLQGVIDDLEDECADNDLVYIRPNKNGMGTPMAYYDKGYIDLNNLFGHIKFVDDDE